MAKMGRPQKEIDADQFEKLCYLQCTLGEIASFFECSEDTIERWAKRQYGITFADAYKRYSAGGKISLRRWQFKQAEHNVSMAIWLGKQLLGQREQVEVASPGTESAVEQIAKALFSREA